MISLFTKKNVFNYGVSIPPSWKTIKEYVKHDLDLVTKYFYNLNKRASSDNILSRMIKHIDINVDRDIYDYVSVLEATYLYTSKSQNITSNLNFGKVIEDEIISSGSILFIEADFDNDLFSLEEDWKKVKSIKPIRYDGINLNLNHPMEINEDLVLTVLHIDIKLVLVQYKYWALERKQMDFDINPSVFVYTFLLPSIIGDLYDFAILNRFFKLEKDIRLPRIPSSNKFKIRNTYASVDRELLELKKNLSSKSIMYDEFLLSIQGVSNDTMYDLLYSGHMLFNKNNLWAELTGRLYTVLEMINFLGEKGLSKNQRDLYEIYIVLKRVKSDRTISSHGLLDLYELIDYYFNNLYIIVKDRKIL